MVGKFTFFWIGIFLIQAPLSDGSPWKNSPFAYPPQEFEKRMRLQSSSASREAQQEQKRQIEGAPVDPPWVIEWAGGEAPSYVQLGQTLERGSYLSTPAGQVARLGFPWGGQAVIAPGASGMVPLDVHPVPSWLMEQGTARFLISQLSGAVTPRRPIRFAVFTPHGVVGVRGTDFVVEVKKEVTQVRVGSGKVWIAKSMDDLMKPKTRREVLAPAVIEMEGGAGGLKTPRKWDRYPWLRHFETHPPEVGEQVKKILEEQKSIRSQSVFAPGAR